MRIRDARVADAAAIANVHVDAWRSAYASLIPDRVLVRMSGQVHAVRWTETLRRRNLRGRIFVAEIDGEGVVGYGSCGPSRVRSLPHAGEIYELYVAPEHQDRGIGRRLLYRLFDALVERGSNSAMVWVLAGNPARFFYETMGGRRVAERDEALWNVVLPEAAYGWNDLKALRTGQAPSRRGSG
jgi:ribosomal protein S18 acetylase RimI-like enzyme